MSQSILNFIICSINEYTMRIKIQFNGNLKMNGCKGWEEIEAFVGIRRMKINKIRILTKMVL